MGADEDATSVEANKKNVPENLIKIEADAGE
jgi:hypothetical protein